MVAGAAELGPPNDKAQVRTVAGILSERGRTGELAWLAWRTVRTYGRSRSARLPPRRHGRLA